MVGCAGQARQEAAFAATLPEDVPVDRPGNGAIFQAGRDLPLFENAVARRVGDTITVNLMETTSATKSASTTTEKSTTVDIRPPVFGGRSVDALSAGLESGRSFDGSGDSSLSNQLRGQLTVTVAQRLSNGNLVVRGQKWISINQGREFVRLQGIVRPVDIQPDNSIPSYKVADASIAYGGQGALADASAPGLLSRFFNSRFNPL
jgi:flagellar L-ring protein precursor FlgH